MKTIKLRNNVLGVLFLIVVLFAFQYIKTNYFSPEIEDNYSIYDAFSLIDSQPEWFTLDSDNDSVFWKDGNLSEKINMQDVYALMQSQDELKKAKDGINYFQLYFIIPSLLIGIFASAIYNQIKENKDGERIIYKELFSKVLHSTYLLKSLLVSPIAMIGIISCADEILNPLLLVLIAFQNGFLVDTLFKGAKKTKPEEKRQPVPAPVSDVGGTDSQ